MMLTFVKTALITAKHEGTSKALIRQGRSLFCACPSPLAAILPLIAAKVSSLLAAVKKKMTASGGGGGGMGRIPLPKSKL